ncbi:MAG: hypothetical protein RI935_246 [Candidatus Parcubacteria bacterium]|jgi:hypothetical protein
MKLVLDFDDVIFNAKAFKELMFFYLAERGIRNAKEVYEQMRQRERAFSVIRYLDELGIKEEEERDEVYEGIMTPCVWLANKEVIALMEQIGKENIFILSQGDGAFQRDKIERSLGGNVLGSHVVVVPESKTEELKRICHMFNTEEVIFVDDKVEFLNAIPVTNIQNLKTVLFNENGLDTLRSEIRESRRLEQERANQERNTKGPTMR